MLRAMKELLDKLQEAYDQVPECKLSSIQRCGIASGPAYEDGCADGERSGLYKAINIIKEMYPWSTSPIHEEIRKAVLDE